MYSVSSSRTRAYFSNPDVNYKGRRVATGTINRNNAKRIRTSGCIISSWEDNPEVPLIASISGPTEVCLCAFFNLHANAEGGAAGPITYEWSYSYNGIQYIDYPFNGSSASFQMPCPSISMSGLPVNLDGMFVRLKVTDSDGSFVYYWKHIKVKVDENGQPCTGIIHQYREVRELSDNFIFSVSPNPTNQDFHLNIETPSENTNKIFYFYLSDISGKLIHSDQFLMQGPKHVELISLNNYPSGTYFLTIRSGNKISEVITLIKQ